MCHIQFPAMGCGHGVVLPSRWHWPAFKLNAQAQQDKILPAVDVIGATPLPGLNVPREQVLVNVTTFGTKQLNAAAR